MSFVKSLIKTVGKVVAPKRLSIGGHKFALSPFDLPQQVVSDVAQGKNAGDVWRGVDESRKAGLRSGAAMAAAYGGAELAGSLPSVGTVGATLKDTINPIAAGKGGVPESVLSAAHDPSRFRSIADFLGGHADDILKYGKAAGDAYGAYRNAKLQDEALGLARGNYNANAPLRDAARAALLDNSRPDLSGVFADPSNPNGRYRRVSVGSRA